MNYLIISIWFIILLSLLIYATKKTKNVFHPLVFFVLFQILKYVLPLFVNKPEYYVTYSINNIVFLITIESVFILSVFLGFNSKLAKTKIKILKFTSKTKKYDMNTNSTSYLAIYSFFTIGFLSRIYIFIQLGGLSYVFSNSHAVYSRLISGFGLVSILARLMLVSIVCIFEKVLKNKKKKDIIIMIIMIVLYMGSYLIYSSRGPALEILLVLLCCYSMNNKKISFKEIIKPKYIIMVLIMILILLSTLARRTNESVISSSISNILEALSSEFNRADRDIFTYNYFSNNTLWYGKIFLNVIYMVIPSFFYINKPPVDDGFYLMNLIRGKMVGPNSGRLDIDMTIGSVPFTSQGLAYANFGVVGVILVGLLTGYLYKKIYDRTKKRNNTLDTLIYFYFIYIFGFTPLLIQNTISIIVFAILMQKISHSKLLRRL